MFKILTAFFLSIFLESCNSRKNENTLIVLTSADNPPYEFFDSKNNKIQGFDIDLIEEIARRIKMEVQVRDMNFSSLIPSLQSGKGDLAIATLSKTEEREKIVDFSIGYHESIPTVLSKTQIEARSYSDLKGKNVGVQLGSAYDVVFKNLVMQEPDLKIKLISLSNFIDLVQELKKGKIDCIITEGVVAQNFIKDGLFTMPLMSQKIDSYCMAFPKSSILLKKFNDTIETLKKEGFIDQLARKWLTNSPIKVAAK